MRRAWLLLALLLPAVASAAPTFKGWAAGAYVQGPDSGGDVTPPTAQSATVAANGTDVTIGHSENINIGANGAGTTTLVLSGGNTTWTYASGDGTSSLVGTAGRTIDSSETGTVTYSAGGADRLEDDAGNDMVSYFGLVITNNSTQDGEAPVFVSAAINVDGDELAVTFDEAVTQGAGYADGDWAATATDGALTFVYASGDTTATHVLTPSRTIGSHEVVTLDWAGTANGMEDAAGNDLAAFADEPVTNASTADTVDPTFVAAAITAEGTVLRWTLSEAMAVGAGGSGGAVLTCSGGAVTATYDAVQSSVILFDLNRTVAPEETCTTGYTQPGNGFEDAAGNDLATFADEAVRPWAACSLSIGAVVGPSVLPSVTSLQCAQ